MAERGTHVYWTGRLVRVLVVFRGLVLLVTVMLLPAGERTAPIGLAVLLAAALSCVPLRHWERIGPSVSRHPAYMAAEILLTTVILAAAGARSPFFYFTLGTAAIAGVIYGRRGALPLSALLIAMYELVALEGLPHLHPLHDLQSVVLLPLLYCAAMAAGVAAREMIARGVTTEALLRDRTEALAVEHERLRVARELHDSLAKTVEGLSLSATVLSGRCRRNCAGAVGLADQLAVDARIAALQARSLMSDLRPDGTGIGTRTEAGIGTRTEAGTRAEAEPGDSLAAVVQRRVQTFAQRSGCVIEFDDELSGADDRGPLGLAEQHELLRILSEALINAQRHAGATRTRVILGRWAQGIRLTIRDDGRGIGDVDLDQLHADGHFGLVGMHERAEAIGGELTVGPAQGGGTLVTLILPDPTSAPSAGAFAPAPLGALLRRASTTRVKA